MISPDRLPPHDVYDKLVELGDKWADHKAAAFLLEKAAKTILAKMKLASLRKSNADKEDEATASPEYDDACRRAAEAQRDALKAQVRYDSFQVYCDFLRSHEATAREEAKMLGRA